MMIKELIIDSIEKYPFGTGKDLLSKKEIKCNNKIKRDKK